MSADGGEDGTYEEGRPPYQPSDGYAPGAQQFSDARSARGGASEAAYEPSSYGRQAARDGYVQDPYSDAYEERSQGYGNKASRGQGYARGYEQPKIGYGGSYDRRNKSYDDLNDRDYDSRSKVQKYQRDDKYREDNYGERSGREDRGSSRRDRGSSRRNRSESRSESDDDGKGKEENPDVAKWGATLAGALAGGFAGHKAKKDNIIGIGIGAVVGGLIAREAEKEVYKYKSHRKEERGMESSSYRSKSR